MTLLLSLLDSVQLLFSSVPFFVSIVGIFALAGVIYILRKIMKGD